MTATAVRGRGFKRALDAPVPTASPAPPHHWLWRAACAEINYAEFCRVLTAHDVFEMKNTLQAVAKGEKCGGVGSGGMARFGGGD